jgi:hypothetical protein
LIHRPASPELKRNQQQKQPGQQGRSTANPAQTALQQPVGGIEESPKVDQAEAEQGQGGRRQQDSGQAAPPGPIPGLQRQEGQSSHHQSHQGQQPADPAQGPGQLSEISLQGWIHRPLIRIEERSLVGHPGAGISARTRV